VISGTLFFFFFDRGSARSASDRARGCSATQARSWRTAPMASSPGQVAAQPQSTAGSQSLSDCESEFYRAIADIPAICRPYEQ